MSFEMMHEVVVLSGINTVSFHSFDIEGCLTTDEKMSRKMTKKIKGRILRFKNDNYDKFGIIILSDDREMSNGFDE